MKTINKLILVAVIVLTGCTTATKMNNLNVGMTKEQVLAVMGSPDNTAAPGNGIESLRYALSTWSNGAHITHWYYVKLVDGKVVSYGPLFPTRNLNIINR
jgi:hypothetical protein